jgi:2-phosphosulfolactate phosphatase
MSGEQAGYQVRFDWGRAGMDAVGPVDVVVWADAIANPGADGWEAAPAGCAVVQADLRTAAAVAGWAMALQLRRRARTIIAVIAAGEARADGSGRYAVEDLLVAGAVIAHLGALGIDATSPEAAAAEAAYRGLQGAVRHLITASVSGRSAAVDHDALRLDPGLGVDAALVHRPHPDA